MKEFDQYRIELTAKDVEDIVTNHMSNYLRAKGYNMDYAFKDSGDSYPEVHFRGVKLDAVVKEASAEPRIFKEHVAKGDVDKYADLFDQLDARMAIINEREEMSCSCHNSAPCAKCCHQPLIDSEEEIDTFISKNWD